MASLGGLGALPHRDAWAQGLEAAEVIADPAAALTVFDFEPAAKRTVTPGHWAYDSPIFLCPTGGERNFHADRALGVARPAPGTRP